MTRDYLEFCSISIHAPARGATEIDVKIAGSMGFQSTLPQGERPIAYLQEVSKRLFQSTLPQGERRMPISILQLGQIFQSTLPQGERHCCISAFDRYCYFNPRSRKGSDTRKGSDIADTYAHVPSAHFNPRSRKGSDIQLRRI